MHFNHQLFIQPMTRFDAVCEIPIRAGNVIAGIFNTAVGLVAAPLNVLTFGRSDTLRSYQCDVNQSNGILRNVYLAFVAVLNPTWASQSFTKTPSSFETTRGIFTRNYILQTRTSARSYAKSNEFFERHVISRTLFALSGLAAKVCRAADLALGLIGLGLTVLTLGQSSGINTFTFHHLEVFGIIDDYKTAICGFINPQIV